MNFLGIDYGRSKVGVAISTGKLAQPLKVIKYTDKNVLIDQIKKLSEQNQIGKIVVGVSEGVIGEESKEFAALLNAELFDETLSTHDAQELSISSGMSRKKRKTMEDAFAATIMLQNYLDR